MRTVHWYDDPRFFDMRTIADLRAVTIAWLNGEVHDLPRYAGPPNDETEPLRDILIALNRRRFLTIESQPGTPTQRANVCGLARHDLAERIWLLANLTDLIAIMTPVAAMNSRPPCPEPGIPVTIWRGEPLRMTGGLVVRDGEPTTFAGRADVGLLTDLIELDIDTDRLGDYAQLDVIDPIWGRQSHLWEVVLAAVGVEPGLASPLSTCPA